jgi:hypothetical protein
MEKVKFSDIRLATNDEWDLIFQKCDRSTFFHSRDWAEIWCIHAQGKWQPQPQLFSFTDGKTALIPLVVQKYLGGLISKGYSCPNYSYGGWISEDELDV